MRHLRRPGFLILMIAVVLMAVSCASGRPPYRQYKPKRPGGCDCSRWSYQLPENNPKLYAEAAAVKRGA